MNNQQVAIIMVGDALKQLKSELTFRPKSHFFFSAATRSPGNRTNLSLMERMKLSRLTASSQKILFYLVN